MEHAVLKLSKQENRRFSEGVLSGILQEQYCPFFNGEKNCCGVASIGGPVNRQRQQRYCSGEYDDCPSYLGYLLRRTRPLRTDSDWLDAV